jgi:hypothetical protein
VFNIQPGTGLGFTGSQQIALGLGTPYTIVIIVVVPPEEEPVSGGSGGGPGARYAGHVDYGFKEAVQKATITSRIIKDDNEVFEIIIIAIESGLIE